eukprot:COSAG01_NODE_61630_length_288_cov_1.481481_1_plen_29_part_10
MDLGELMCVVGTHYILPYTHTHTMSYIHT